MHESSAKMAEPDRNSDQTPTRSWFSGPGGTPLQTKHDEDLRPVRPFLSHDGYSVETFWNKPYASHACAQPAASSNRRETAAKTNKKTV